MSERVVPVFSRKTIIIFILLLTGAIYFFYTQNNGLVQSSHTIRSADIPTAFNGFTITHLSDLHSKEFGNQNQRLISKVIKQEPDVIFMTGDLIDSYSSNNGEGTALMEQLVEVAPVYFVTGNHEWRLGIVDELEEELRSYGVEVLRNETVIIEHNGQAIQLIGIDDPDSEPQMNESQFSEEVLDAQQINKELFTILLAHRPEVFSSYQRDEIDLVFSGHAHGGQIRLPLIGGLLSPGQGFFPTYSEGVHEENDTTMLVSRGLGNSLFPLRLFNRPELIEVKLACEPCS